jgi:hypothetical protein
MPPEFEPDLKRGNWIKTILIVAGLILIAIGGGGILRHLRKKVIVTKICFS